MTRPFWVLSRGRSKVRGRSTGLGLRSPALCDLGRVPSPPWASLFPLANDGFEEIQIAGLVLEGGMG